jgi:hypothetical protein
LGVGSAIEEDHGFVVGTCGGHGHVLAPVNETRLVNDAVERGYLGRANPALA